ncbi:NAD(P) transhydrogenase subunit alpha [Secundilactobacillus paracollinoides]|uniref:proton-translocating NAD(P)(+) transhydrogenase n=1 Tax=Secundilactobacillus paracollinoides TaxID=240427 RepID=A0A1B2IZV1_9LACO|nr:NAD(P) transhydrogenase subunit alpha [Secundilactobacillus paracollinoides]ANZ61649.1 NAD(P) transhydrogenase subunit alpha [Secundilactobacillus paracollinoides]ANZ67567.1 NAD(P) transhydrogenase subunit alpha [Secundilactobacillus paracollinoides]
MAIVVSVLKEEQPHEKRVAIDPDVTKRLIKAGAKVLVERGAGVKSYYSDAAYEQAGAELVDRTKALSEGTVIAVVNRPSDETLKALTSGQVLIGLLNALIDPDKMQQLAAQKVSALSFELLPRTISRAQTMDVLSSQSSVAGYKAALVASDLYPKYFPMMITAAGTVKPAKVLVLGTGVAGLQAIGTAKRLGAVVSGYDVRPASKGEVESLGATFLTSSVSNGAGSGGYARALTAEETEKQQEELAGFIAENDVIITTAQVPGHKPPLMVPATSVDNAKPGTVFIDLAASDLGGNVAGSQPFETVTTDKQVMVVGASNLASELPHSASQLFAKNVQAVINAMLDDDGNIAIDPTDDVFSGLTATTAGEIVNARLREALNLQPLTKPEPASTADEPAETKGAE